MTLSFAHTLSWWGLQVNVGVKINVIFKT